jgi:hypothetical protein
MKKFKKYINNNILVSYGITDLLAANVDFLVQTSLILLHVYTLKTADI